MSKMQDRWVNEFRAAAFSTFASLLVHSMQTPQTPLLEQWGSNIGSVGTRLCSLLDLVWVNPQKMRDHVSRLLRLTSEFALQFGIQPSRLELNFPRVGSQELIGNEFQHWQNGALDKNKRIKVEFFTTPGLVRVGNGKDDLTSRVVLKPCDVYVVDKAL